MVAGIDKPLRLGIVGLGWVARDYMLPAIAEVPGVQLAAVCDLHAPTLPAAHQAARYYSQLGDMLAEAALEGVYIATPNHLHAEQAVACLEAGVGVLLEKPMAPTAREAERIAEAAERTGTAYATAFDQRHHPAHRCIAELIAEGRIGILTQVRLDYACWLPDDWSPDAATGGAPAPDNWRIDRARAGGGAVIDLAPHGLDLVEALTGQRITTLTGMYQLAVHDYGVDDGGALVGRLSGGALLAHTVGYNRPERLPRRRLELIGTAGMLTAVNTMGQTPGGTLTLTDAASGEERPIGFDVSRGPFAGQLAAFAKTLRGEVSASARSVADDLRLAHLLEEAMGP